jgi:hypothetical protein
VTIELPADGMVAAVRHHVRSPQTWASLAMLFLATSAVDVIRLVGNLLTIGPGVVRPRPAGEWAARAIGWSVGVALIYWMWASRRYVITVTPDRLTVVVLGGLGARARSFARDAVAGVAAAHQGLLVRRRRGWPRSALLLRGRSQSELTAVARIVCRTMNVPVLTLDWRGRVRAETGS